jgi:parvulin-like peptidyl-prolyl isomerase
MAYQWLGRIRAPRANVAPNVVRILALAAVAVVYLGVFAVVARSVGRSAAPPHLIRSATRFFPLPVARVDTSVIWAHHYFDRYDYIDSFIQKTDLTDFSPEKTRDQVIDYLVETSLIEDLAGQQRVRVSQADVARAFDDIASAPNIGGPAEIERVLKELYGMTPNAFRRLIAEQLLRERIEQQVFLHVNTRHILVSSESLAHELTAKIAAGEDFVALSKQFSQDGANRDSGGALGPIGRGSSLPDPLEDAIFSLPPEALPIVVKSDLGYHVIDTEDRVGIIDENFADWLSRQKHERSIAVYLPTTLDWAKR